MSIAKKYNIPEQTVKDMVKKGVISCSIVRHYEIFEYYEQYYNSNPTLRAYEVLEHVGEHFKVSPETVKKIAREMR